MALVLIFPNDFSGEYREKPDGYERDYRDVEAIMKCGPRRKTKHVTADRVAGDEGRKNGSSRGGARVLNQLVQVGEMLRRDFHKSAFS